MLKHLDRSKIESIVMVPCQGIFWERFAALGIQVVEMPRITERTNRLLFHWNNRLTVTASYVLNSLSTLSTIPSLARFIRKRGIAAVHCNNMLVKIPGALAAQLAKVPAVLHVRNLHETRPKVMMYGNLARLPAVRRIISNSAASAVPYRCYAPEKVVVVPNGVDLQEYSPKRIERGQLRKELRLSSAQPIVGFTGNLIPRKGLEFLIRAAAKVIVKQEGVVFVVVGRVPIGNSIDYLARYRALVNELGIGHRFFFSGFRKDVRPAVVDFDILVLPSLQEPFGRSIIEAMALGTPVIASRVGGVPEILTHEQDGLLVEPGDVEGLAVNIERLLVNPTLRQDFVEEALKTVSKRFNVAALTRQIEEHLLGVVH